MPESKALLRLISRGLLAAQVDISLRGGVWFSETLSFSIQGICFLCDIRFIIRIPLISLFFERCYLRGIGAFAAFFKVKVPSDWVSPSKFHVLPAVRLNVIPTLAPLTGEPSEECTTVTVAERSTWGP